MKSRHHLCLAAVALLVAISLSVPALRAEIPVKPGQGIIGRVATISVDDFRIIQAAMPAYDRANLPFHPHRVMLIEADEDPLHYSVSFWPRDVDIEGNFLTVILDKETLEIVRVIGPDEHVR